MEQLIMENLGAVIAGLGGLFSVWILQNTALKDGITNLILTCLGRFGSKKIDLKYHKAFLILKNHKANLSLYLVANYVKAMYYKEMVGIMFDNLHTTYNNIIDLYNKGEYKAAGSMEIIILKEFDDCKAKSEEEIRAKLKTPEKVAIQVLQWRDSMWNSLRNSIEDLVSTATTDTPYVQTYKALDALLVYSVFITSTGSILFSSINGAFDELTMEEIYKK